MCLVLFIGTLSLWNHFIAQKLSVLALKSMEISFLLLVLIVLFRAIMFRISGILLMLLKWQTQPVLHELMTALYLKIFIRWIAAF